MLAKTNLLCYFEAKVGVTACYVGNGVLVCPQLKMTLYELLNGRKPNIPIFEHLGVDATFY